MVDAKKAEEYREVIDQTRLRNAKVWWEFKKFECDCCRLQSTIAYRMMSQAERLAWSLREVILWRTLHEALLDWVPLNRVVWAFAVRHEMVDIDDTSPGNTIFEQVDEYAGSTLEQLINDVISDGVLVIRFNLALDRYEYRWRRDDNDEPR